MRSIKKVIWLALLFVLVWGACRPALPPSPPEGITQEPAPAQAVTPTPTPTPKFVVSGGTSGPPPPSPPPPTGYKPKPVPKTDEEALKQRQEAIKQLEAEGLSPGTRVSGFGPETKGATILVAGKKIKLPEDAYIAGGAATIECPFGLPCAQPPTIGIQRKMSKIVVSVPTGIIHGEIIAPGEEGAFDFLYKELPPQTSGVKTMGATIIIAGKSIKLPDNAWIGAITESFKSPEYVPAPFKNAKLPIYAIVRSKSAIHISAVDGKVLYKLILPGDEHAFDFLTGVLP